MEPTKEQIQWLWEQCGFRYFTDEKGHWKDCTYWHNPPNTDEWGATWLPPIDLNNLFKYAVPKLTRYNLWCNTRWDEETRGVVQDDCGALVQVGFGNKITGFGTSTDKDPTLALFWAIYKALGGKDGKPTTV